MEVKSRTGTMSDNKKDDKIPFKEKYFFGVSDKYSKVARVLLIVATAYFLLTLIFNSKVLTYNNFNYLMRDLGAAADIAASDYNSISYKNDELRVTKSYRGGIITVSTTDLTIYTATGRKTLLVNESFVAPEIATSKKYAVVYDLGGKNYSVYNSFAEISSGSYDYPIGYATASDSGWFALVSKDDTHNSVVYLYDDDCQLRNTYRFGTKYVFSVAINDKGNRIIILASEADGDKFSTYAMLYEPGKDKKLAELKIGDGLPCGCGFAKDGNIQVVTTKSFYVLDKNNARTLNSYEFGDRILNKVSINKNGVSVSFVKKSGSAENEILVFDKNGKMIYNTVVEGSMLDLEYSDECIFVNQSTSILKINTKNDTRQTYKVSDFGTDIIVYDNNNLLLCCQTKAKYINF